MARQIKLFDTTLRDGEQSPGCSMNLQDKLEVAESLASLGVDIIEAGFAIASPEISSRTGDREEYPRGNHRVPFPCSGKRYRRFLGGAPRGGKSPHSYVSRHEPASHGVQAQEDTGPGI